MALLRPNGYGEQVAAADGLIVAGRADEALPYIDRSIVIAKALGIAVGFDWPRTYEVKKRWVKGDVAGAWARLREMSATAERNRDGDLLRILTPWYVSLGRLREADSLLLKRLEEAERHPGKPERGGAAAEMLPEIGLAWNAELRGDRKAARAWIQRLSRRVPPEDRETWWEVPLFQGRMGLAAEMRRSLAKPLAAKREAYTWWMRGELALAEGRPAEAATLLAKTLAALPPGNIRRGVRPAPMLAIQTLASALEATRGPQAALDAIARNIWPPDRTVTLQHMNASAWLELQARRARLLRRLGRPAEAKLVEDDLRKYLAYADADLVMLRELRMRPSR
jgi:tetratricopeptide (TPR) repeat protein